MMNATKNTSRVDVAMTANAKMNRRLIVLCIEKASARGEIFNVASGKPITIKEVAEVITNKINPNLEPIYNQQYRIGDIRHCLADISKIKDKLGYSPKIEFKDGINDLIEWIRPQIKGHEDKSQIAIDELKKTENFAVLSHSSFLERLPKK